MRRRARRRARGEPSAWPATLFTGRQAVVVDNWTLANEQAAILAFAKALYGDAKHASQWRKRWQSATDYVADFDKVAARVEHGDLFLFLEARLVSWFGVLPAKEAVRMELVRSMARVGQRGATGGSAFGYEMQRLGILLTLLGTPHRVHTLFQIAGLAYSRNAANDHLAKESTEFLDQIIVCLLSGAAAAFDNFQMKVRWWARRRRRPLALLPLPTNPTPPSSPSSSTALTARAS